MSATRAWLAAVLVGLLPCVGATQAIACACCSEEGQYLVAHNGKASDLQIAEMAHMKFGATAGLYVGAADKDDVKGIRSETGESRAEPTERRQCSAC